MAFKLLLKNRMMETLLDELQNTLQQDERLVIDGKLAKNKVVELALKLDKDLLKLLLDNKRLKARFFTDVDGTFVFDKHFFQRFVTNKQFLPDSYTAFKNKIGLSDNNEDYLKEKNDVSLIWPYKDCVLEGGQTKEDAKRSEIFWNKTLAPDQIDRLLDPKVLSNFKMYDKDGEHTVSRLSLEDNMLVEGNNLLALHSLEKVFTEKIKLIYIDPPFNTGNDDFGYNDNFNHSTWLTFLKDRIEIAKKLLSPDGFLCLHIDEEEVAYSKVLVDEIFGRDNFVNTICINDSHPSGLKLAHREKKIIKTKSYVHVYKSSDSARINPIYKKREDWDTHFNKFVETGDEDLEHFRLIDYIKSHNIVDEDFVLSKDSLKDKGFREFAFKNQDKIFQSTKEVPADVKKLSNQKKGQTIEYEGTDDSREFALNGRRLSPLSKSIWNIGIDGYEEYDFAKLVCDFWDDVDFNNTQNEGGVSFTNGKKPEFLLARLITMFTKEGDRVMDFFLGSGTTTAVAHKMKRKYIGIEQLDYGKNSALKRMQSVIKGDKTGVSKYLKWNGGGQFKVVKLMKYNSSIISEIEITDSSDELLSIWSKINDVAFLSYQIDPSVINKEKDSFSELTIKEQKQLLVEVLDKNQLYVNYSEIDDEEYNVSEDDKKLNHQFYSLNQR